MLDPAPRYTGYTAYDYLEPGKDYREFRYAKQIGRVPEYAGLDLSDAQKERTTTLLSESTVISLHDHVQVFPEDMTQLRDHIRRGRVGRRGQRRQLHRGDGADRRGGARRGEWAERGGVDRHGRYQ